MNNISKIADANNLIKAYKKSRKDSSWKESVQRYGMDLLVNTAQLQKELLTGTYKQKPFYEFTLCERGKTRPIKSLNIKDRVVQRSLCDNVLNPQLLKYLIYDNGASVKDKGMDFARRRFVKHLSDFIRKYGNDGYILQIDFSKFFDNIPHKELIQKIEERLSDDTANHLIRQIIDSFKIDVSYMTDDEYKRCGNTVFNLLEHNTIDKSKLTGQKYMYKSMGIGSQISQIAGIFYPTPIDTHCKIVRRCKYYGRYMDDIYIIHQDKAFLYAILSEIIQIARQNGLYINEKKTHIVKLSHGFTFLQVKYNITNSNKIIRRLKRPAMTRQRKRMKAKTRLVKQDILTNYKCILDYNSWRGGIKHFNNYKSVRGLDMLCKQLYERSYAYDTRTERKQRV